MNAVPEGKQLILFDGVCNLCSASVQFIIKRDKKDVFRYASLQSDLGEQFIKERNIDTTKVDSIILVEPGKAYHVKSSAAIRIAKHLGAAWPLLQIFLILPSFLRNFFYDIIAKNRYKWFGRQDACWLPTPELKAKFLD